jgi:hypothetical protein
MTISLESRAFIASVDVEIACDPGTQHQYQQSHTTTCGANRYCLHSIILGQINKIRVREERPVAMGYRFLANIRGVSQSRMVPSD